MHKYVARLLFYHFSLQDEQLVVILIKIYGG